MRELKIAPWVTVPEPNTWRELLAALDATGESLKGKTHRRPGVRRLERRSDRRPWKRAARDVTRVPVYRWALPEDMEPLRKAVAGIARGELDVAIFTTSIQIVHLMQVAETMGQADAVRDGLRRMVVASIGPTCTEELRNHGLAVDLEATHPEDGVPRARSRRTRSRPAAREANHEGHEGGKVARRLQPARPLPTRVNVDTCRRAR